MTAAEAKFAVAGDEQGFPPQEIEPPGLTLEVDPTQTTSRRATAATHRLLGLRALITGGDSGIGRAVAIAFARERRRCRDQLLHAEQPDADATASVSDAGRRAALVPGDLTDVETCHRVMADTVGQLGVLDILVKNAAYQWRRGKPGLDGLDFGYLDRTLKTIVYTLFWLTLAALPHLRAGASIINTSSGRPTTRECPSSTTPP